MNIQALINDKVSQALEAAGAPAGSPAAVRQSAKAQFGDYQANGVMGVAKNWVLTLASSHKKLSSS